MVILFRDRTFETQSMIDATTSTIFGHDDDRHFPALPTTTATVPAGTTPVMIAATAASGIFIPVFDGQEKNGMDDDGNAGGGNGQRNPLMEDTAAPPWTTMTNSMMTMMPMVDTILRPDVLARQRALAHAFGRENEYEKEQVGKLNLASMSLDAQETRPMQDQSMDLAGMMKMEIAVLEQYYAAELMIWGKTKFRTLCMIEKNIESMLSDASCYRVHLKPMPRDDVYIYIYRYAVGSLCGNVLFFFIFLDVNVKYPESWNVVSL